MLALQERKRRIGDSTMIRGIVNICDVCEYTLYHCVLCTAKSFIHIECVKRSIAINPKNNIANESLFLCLSFCFDMFYVFIVVFLLQLVYSYQKKKNIIT